MFYFFIYIYIFFFFAALHFGVQHRRVVLGDCADLQRRDEGQTAAVCHGLVSVSGKQFSYVG